MTKGLRDVLLLLGAGMIGLLGVALMLTPGGPFEAGLLLFLIAVVLGPFTRRLS